MARYKATKNGMVKLSLEEEMAANQREIEYSENANDRLKKECETAIEALIQSKVDAYNAANKLSLRDAATCAIYAPVDGYTHQAFCKAIWAWNVEVWETARLLLDRALAGEIVVTSSDDVFALLPEFQFEV